MALLEGMGLSKRFGGVLALSRVDFVVVEDQIVGLIGPNGAGKTTLFNVISGVFRPTAGRVLFDGQEIKGWMPYRVCRLGIGRTFQVARPFLEMTCLENALVAAVNRHGKGHREEDRDLAEESLEFVGLAGQKATAAKNLNLIDKKRLELARVLAAEPKMVLLDELLGGLNTQEIGQAVDLIQRLRDDRGQTIFWIEHVMGAIMSAAERVIVLNEGMKLMEGTPRDVVHDERVIKAYLGH